LGFKRDRRIAIFPSNLVVNDPDGLGDAAVAKGRTTMKIAITAGEATLDTDIDPRLGRCAYFLIVDPDTLEFEAVENANVALGGGAGIQSARLIAAKDIKFVLTGHCGPNAYETLTAAGIEVITGCSGAVRDAIERFKAGQLRTASEPNVAGHSGTAGTASPVASEAAPSRRSETPDDGPGLGGRGMGRGLGRRMRRRRGRGA
jgi:predicted Fe-Mo cluster-binding NifX family protein